LKDLRRRLSLALLNIENAANPALQIIFFMTFILPEVNRKKRKYLQSSQMIENYIYF
jgi:hypothetical protein